MIKTKETVFVTDTALSSVDKDAEAYIEEHQDTIVDITHRMFFDKAKQTTVKEIHIIEEVEEFTDEEIKEEMKKLRDLYKRK